MRFLICWRQGFFSVLRLFSSNQSKETANLLVLPITDDPQPQSPPHETTNSASNPCPWVRVSGHSPAWNVGSFQFLLGLGRFFQGRSRLFGRWGRVFGKRADGTLSPMGLLAFAPCLVLTLMIAAVCRWTFRELACQQISERLYFGRRLLERESGVLGQLKIVAVLDLTAATSEPRPTRDAIAYRSIPLLDATAPSLEVLSEAVRWIIEQSEDGPVYVHVRPDTAEPGCLLGPTCWSLAKRPTRTRPFA
jgi:hypothetical protein